jgi:excisionase family DNA binding protein
MSIALPVLLRIEDVARLLQLSRSKAYSMAKAGGLPAVRIGKSIRIPESALADWLTQHGVPVVRQEPTGASVATDEVKQLLSRAGLTGLGKTSSIRKATPALRRLGLLLQDRTPLERWMAREECVAILTRAKVRSPARAVDLALGTGLSR